jgi:hypothetical protein
MNKEKIELTGVIGMNVALTINDDVSNMSRKEIIKKLKNRELSVSISIFENEEDYDESSLEMIFGEIDEKNVDIDYSKTLVEARKEKLKI